MGIFLQQIQHLCPPELLHGRIIGIGDGTAADREGIFRLPVSRRCIDHEQPAGLACRAAVTVGHIHQIPDAIALQNVPHMPPCSRAAGHGTRDAVAIDHTIKCAQIAKILKRLGVSLTYHIGIGAAVKYMDQLPRIAIAAGCTVCRAVIIARQLTDLIPIGSQLFQIRFILMLGDDLLRLFHSRSRCAGLGGIQRILGTVGLYRAESEGALGQIHPAALVGNACAENQPAVRMGFMEPVQVIGAVVQQCGQHRPVIHVLRNLLKKRRLSLSRKLTVLSDLHISQIRYGIAECAAKCFCRVSERELGRAALSGCNFFDGGFQLLIQQPFAFLRQLIGTQSTKQRDIAIYRAVHLPLRISGKTFIGGWQISWNIDTDLYRFADPFRQRHSRQQRNAQQQHC